MNRIREIYSRLKRDQKYASWFQFIKFGLVGVSNTLISLAIYYLVICINQNWYIVGNTLGWVVGVANAFFWNNRYVFKSADTCLILTIKRLMKTYLTYGATWLLSSMLLWLEVNIFEINAWLAPVINLLVTIPLNFFLNKYWAFR